ncbi:SGNH/GDSL hydrolase family protein [Paracoccus lutimaris]|uniref:GDSL-like lipase/acylhydrolase family protein n=1 Tax=Paracoccus lutimaris TaxID=1490030 RepID=A0A368Z9T5_9RHOB|nr:SGNH/GDSL hydrolase family protein [Paracoccus lutimaris]RCW88779.1 GDSL-like lipase/acylhydrolase family protein [Paracoccus lutimaris]
MRHRRIRSWALGLSGATFAVALATFAWPQPPFPETPVPALRLTPDAPFAARLIAPQPGLTALPAQITGRVAAGDASGSLLHEWPALRAEARFQGSAITLRLNDSVDRWRVTLDGSAVEIARPGQKDLRIEGLPSGPHLIRAERISEWHGPAEFDGFFLDAGATPLPAPQPPARLIEFIGDSDTVGFGNTSQRRDCDSEQVFAATDTSRAFPARLAQDLGTDYRVIARSGIGLLRNYGGVEPQRTMRQLYPLALPSQPEAARLPGRKADLLVIGLGSNDFGSGFATGEPWQDKAALSRDFGPALAEFARARLAENPDAQLILLAFGEYGEELIAPYRQTAEALAADGVGVKLVVLPDLQRSACLWHPSMADHAMIAKTLAGTVRDTLPGWGG